MDRLQTFPYGLLTTTFTSQCSSHIDGGLNWHNSPRQLDSPLLKSGLPSLLLSPHTSPPSLSSLSSLSTNPDSILGLLAAFPPPSFQPQHLPFPICFTHGKHKLWATHDWSGNLFLYTISHYLNCWLWCSTSLVTYLAVTCAVIPHTSGYAFHNRSWFPCTTFCVNSINRINRKPYLRKIKKCIEKLVNIIKQANAQGKCMMMYENAAA